MYRSTKSFRAPAFPLLLVLCGPPAFSQITVEGLTDKTVYADTVTFRVPAAAGFETTAALDGTAAAVGVQVMVNRPMYHELLVHRRNLATSAEESRLVQFIVRSSERRDSEWGLPPWVPYPVIPSAAAEFAGSTLVVVTPRRFPQGIEIPIIGLVEDGSGARVGVNGAVVAAEFPGRSIELRRGVGSSSLPAATAPGLLTYTGAIQGLEASVQITIDDGTSWTTVSGSLGASTDWGEDARIDITGDVTVAAGATLTIGAGSILRLGPGVEVTVNGRIVVNGTRERPVVFTPRSRSSPWGGLRFRSAAVEGDLNGAIFTGSGADPDWFDNNPGNGSSHRDEEPLIYVSGGARVTMTDCYLVDNQGQAGHGEGGFLTMNRCLIEKAITAGQYNGGSVTLTGCALLQFPADGAPFADVDNDAFYLTGGSHSLTDCLVGWALDDGIDAGSGSAGSVKVTGCWFESTYHEGMAWSETRLPEVKDTVVLNCGQGMECGFGNPDVVADHILSTANLTGARFGDNYDWDYDGHLEVTNSLLLYNLRNIWGRAWDDWTEHLSQMDLHSNFLSEPDPNHPANSVWDPAVDAFRLGPFLPSPATAVGIGFALRADHFEMPAVTEGVPVRLSTFTTIPVLVDIGVESEDGPLGSATLRFEPGETVKVFQPEIPDPASRDLIRLTLTSPQNGEFTGRSRVDYIRYSETQLIASGSVWKYLDNGSNQGTNWRTPEFDDGPWKMGAAELGFGDDDEETPINGGPATNRFRTTYFRRSFDVPDPSIYDLLLIRLRRDDGAIVYLNGEEVFRSNIREGTVDSSTLAITSQTSETAFFPKEIGAQGLVTGTNVIAVEVHQAAPDSSDLSFELELIGKGAPGISGDFVRGDANNDERLDISDPLKVLLVLFAGSTGDCDDSMDGDDDGILAITDAIYILNYLFRGGPVIPPPFPERGPDPSEDALGCERG